MRHALNLQAEVKIQRVVRVLAQLSFLFAFVANAEEPQSPGKKMSQEEVSTHLNRARGLIEAHQPLEAIEQHLDPVISHFEEAHAGSEKILYSAREPTLALVYLTAANAAQEDDAKPRDALVLGPEWADAYHLKGFALVELKDFAGATEALRSALRLSPREPQYLSELAYVAQGQGKSEEALKLFRDAEEAAEFIQDPERKQAETGRACRGQGYALIEMQKLDEADLQYRKCLDLDPGDKISQGELEYIDQVRKN